MHAQKWMQRLRKAGYYVYPARIEPIVAVGLKPGICVLVTKNLDLLDYLHVFSRHAYYGAVYVVNAKRVFKYDPDKNKLMRIDQLP